MLKDITLGQYFPGKSPIHLLDPRTKLIMLVVYIVALFMASNWISYGLMFLFLVMVIAVSRIPVKSILRGMKPLMMILIFTGVLNLFFTEGETVLVSFWVITITKEGLIRAVFMVARILMLISGTFLLTYTTSPISLTDGLEALMNPLKVIKVPVHEIAMMISIAFRFIPILMEEADKIMKAQKARGADFETGGLIKKAKAMIPLLVPLLISAIKRAMDLANAMEARCYRGGEGRTKMKPLKYKKVDTCAYVTIVVFMLALVATIFVNDFVMRYINIVVGSLLG